MAASTPIMDMSSLNLYSGNAILREMPNREFSTSPESIIPTSTESEVIVVVDPVSTGACLAHTLAARGYDLVRAWSDMCPDVVKNHTKEGMEVAYVGCVQHKGDLGETVGAIKKLGRRVRAVLVGCETGVLFTDQLAHALGVHGNGVELSSLRRHKFDQVERVRAAGLDAPLQTLATSQADVERFLSTTTFPEPFKAVVKPVEGAASDGVSICDSVEEVRAAYANLEGTSNVLGLVNNEVLLQEYLRGDEYVIDTVSADGVHKCVAVWKYDKRPANGAPVVYFGMQLLRVDAAHPEVAAMIEYTYGVLGSLGIRWGAMHTEVKLEERGPVLVEVNCRLHGGEGIWLPIAEASLGYTQVSAMADAYLNRRAFDALPREPSRMRSHGAWVTVRANASGTIRALHHAKLDEIRRLPSFLDEYLPLTVGKRVAMTVDACGVHGCFNLSHPDEEQLARDYEYVQALVEEGLFDLDAANEDHAEPESVDVQ